MTTLPPAALSCPGRKLPEPVFAALVAARDAEGLDAEVVAHLAHDARAVVEVHRRGQQAEAVQQEELAGEAEPEAGQGEREGDGGQEGVEEVVDELAAAVAHLCHDNAPGFEISKDARSVQSESIPEGSKWLRNSWLEINATF